ncbi:hypothetical protein Tco_0793947 [Tanacetum coccineum]
MDSDLNNQNDQWELNLDIDDSDLRLTPVLHPCSSTHVETSTTTQKPVRIIPGPASIVQKVVEDMGEDEDFKSGLWVSATNYVNANGGIVSGCLGDIKNFFKNGKLDQVVAIVKYYSPNVIGDLIVTLKDLSGTIPCTIHHKVIDESGYGKDITVGTALILANVLVFSPKPSMHYFNITMRNVVKVFRKDTVPGSDSGVGGSGMLMEEEEIVKLMKDEEMADLELQVCENITDQEMTDKEALNLALEEEVRQARVEHEWLLEALGEQGDAVRCLDHMREIVARDSAKLGVLEQVLFGTHVGIGLKDSYVADMEENE